MTKTHKHGGNPLEDLARFNLPEQKIIDFSVNLNPIGMPGVIQENWSGLINSVKDYPSIEGHGIIEFYTKKAGVDPSEFIAGNGSTELIYLIPRVLGFKKVLIITPSFHDYERASLLTGAEILRYPLSPENNFNLDNLSGLESQLAECDALWLGRPNNPTASLISKDLIIELAQKHPDKYFIIDEAFIQFSDNWKEESLISSARLSNVILIHSFTKFYAIAGLRMGGVIGHRDVISRLKSKKEPWSVNGIAEAVALLLLECDDYEAETMEYLKNERNRLYNGLAEIKNIDVFPSVTNFFLCRWKETSDLDDLIVHLLKNGIYIRDCRNFHGLEDNWFRVGIRTSNDNDVLLSSLASFRKGE